jgi:hypothetical protein
MIMHVIPLRCIMLLATPGIREIQILPLRESP